MRISACICLTALLLSLQNGCADYDLKVNERVVYTPPALFSDFETPDEGLQACLQQAITDNSVHSADQLLSLNCSHAGIANLEGLSVFTGLKQLKLSSNNILNLAQISALSGLEELYLDTNRIVDPVPLYNLTALDTLDLSNNPALQCPEGDGFASVTTLSLPEHCN